MNKKKKPAWNRTNQTHPESNPNPIPNYPCDQIADTNVALTKSDQRISRI